MSDMNYMNTYVNLAVETVHNYLNDILQLKTQLTLINGLMSEKDQTIVALSEELETLKMNSQKQSDSETEMQKLRDNAATWEFQYNNMTSKVAHMDTLTAQYNELKNNFLQLQNKHSDCEQKINSLKNELSSTKSKLTKFEKKEDKKPLIVSDKKSINKEEPKSIFISKNMEKLKETDDDF